MEAVAESHVKVEIPSQVCGFRLGNDYFCISVLDIQEVIKPQNVTPIPLANDFVRGLINLRGQIVTSISLKTMFKMEEDPTSDHMNVIVRKDETLAALVVDEILDVVDVEPSTFESTPESLNPNIKEYIKGVFKLDDKILIFLHLDRILDF